MIGDATASGKVIESTKKRIRPEGLKKTRAVKPGDFIVSNSMSFGRPYIMGIEGCIHDGWLLLRPRGENVDPDYFYHLLGSQTVYAKFSSRAAGATVKNLNSDIVRNVSIPLPPLEEQRRIAGILDQADALRRLRTRALDKLNTLGQAIFHEMFGDVQTNPTGLPTRSLSQVATFTSGATPSKKNGSFWEDGDIPWITPKDMKSYELYGSIDRVTRLATEQTNLKSIPAGTPLIVVRGMILAHTVPLGITRTACTINQDMKAINFSDSVLPEFGLACLLAQHDSLLTRVDTAAHGTKRFDLDRLAETLVLVPSLEVQQRFLDALHVARQVVGNSRAARIVDQGLFASLQHRAFRGEL